MDGHNLKDLPASLTRVLHTHTHPQSLMYTHTRIHAPSLPPSMSLQGGSKRFHPLCDPKLTSRACTPKPCRSCRQLTADQPCGLLTSRACTPKPCRPVAISRNSQACLQGHLCQNMTQMAQRMRSMTQKVQKTRSMTQIHTIVTDACELWRRHVAARMPSCTQVLPSAANAYHTGHRLPNGANEFLACKAHIARQCTAAQAYSSIKLHTCAYLGMEGGRETRRRCT